MWRWGIKNRVLFVALVPLILIVIALTTLFVRARFSDMDNALIERGRVLARQLAPACEYGVLAGNSQILTTLAQSAMRESDVVSVSITDDRNQPLASANAPGIEAQRPAAIDAQPAGVQSEVQHVKINGSHVFRAPILQSRVSLDADEVTEVAQAAPGAAAVAKPASRQIGWVIVELTTANTRAYQKQALINGLAVSLIGLLLTTLIALRMARGVTTPILGLTTAVKRIRDGFLDHRVAAKSGGELGQLEVGINAMAQALKDAHERTVKQAEDALFQEKVRAQVTLASIGDGVITTDADGRIVYLNPVAEQFTETSGPEAAGMPLRDVFRIVDETSGEPVSYPLHYCLKEGRIIRHDSHHLLINRDGAKVEIQDSAAPIRDRDGAILGAVVVFRDVSEIQHMVRRMAFLASHDPLTGLINRREFENRLHLALEGALNNSHIHALLYIDLDQFKIVNDTSGHIAGDELLKQLAHHLSREIRSSDVLARLGGDEFGVILEHCSVEKGLQIAEILRQSVKEFRFAWQTRLYEVGASIGLVPINADSGNITELLSAADSACYVAKDRGRNRIHVYQPDDAALAQRQGEMQWVHRLREGLDRSTFDLYAQAIVPLAEDSSHQDRFYEILVRIQDREVVTPSIFLPAAERYHLMPAIDRWVVRASLSLLKEFYAGVGSRLAATRFAINLSGQTLGDDQFTEFIEREIAQSGVDPRRLCFEITETAAIANLSRARQFILQLKGMGCEFALDDFGSGLSSFGYLKSLPVDYLKIAGDFIRDIGDDAVDHAMVDAINQIGHVMGLATIAESVEQAGTLDKLRALGVNYGQGFGIEPPRPLYEVLGVSSQKWLDVRAGAQAILR
jgi:diguanylate cyclase (GGDEF)-like protein/PAS domain S-box-containing protein